MQRSILLILILAFFMPAADALDDIQGVTAVWNDFVESIRRGDYRNAHNLFSPQSRAAMPYGEFVAEYGPLSAAREMVLAKPDSQSTSLDVDWAEISYGGTNPGTGRKFKVGVSFARNQGAWGLVAARNEAAERVEAGARAFLAALWGSREQGSPQELLAVLQRLQGGSPVFKMYRLEWNGQTFQAFPREKGLRTFFLDGMGRVRSAEGDRPAAPRSQAREVVVPAQSVLPAPMPEVAEPAGPVLDEDGMPELTEPPESGFGGGTNDFDADIPEMFEPATPERPRGPAAAPSVILPDVIR